MRTLLALLLFAASPVRAEDGKVIFWDLSSTPPSYRVLQHGALTGPFTGVAEGPLLGTVYTTNDPQNEIRVTTPYPNGTAAHRQALSAMVAAIAAYNVPRLAQVSPMLGQLPDGRVVLATSFDLRTGLVLSVAEAAGSPHAYSGFVYAMRPDGTWYAADAGHEIGAIPTPWATRVANATRKVIEATPTLSFTCPVILLRAGG